MVCAAFRNRNKPTALASQPIRSIGWRHVGTKTIFVYLPVEAALYLEREREGEREREREGERESVFVFDRYGEESATDSKHQPLFGFLPFPLSPVFHPYPISSSV